MSLHPPTSATDTMVASNLNHHRGMTSLKLHTLGHPQPVLGRRWLLAGASGVKKPTTVQAVPGLEGSTPVRPASGLSDRDGRHSPWRATRTACNCENFGQSIDRVLPIMADRRSFAWTRRVAHLRRDRGQPGLEPLEFGRRLQLNRTNRPSDKWQSAPLWYPRDCPLGMPAAQAGRLR